MKLPERVTVPTCVGCGSMAVPGSCETGCREHRLDLVRAAASGAMSTLRSDAHAAAESLRSVAARLASEAPAPGEWEASYRSVRDDARAALRRHPRVASDDLALAEPAATATTWWCPACGGVDAPQECLGICVWRPVEWVSQAVYDRERERALAEHEIEQRLRELLSRIAWVTPRPGQWERSWRALQEEARRELGQLSPR
jgi:hypothetical protein